MRDYEHCLMLARQKNIYKKRIDDIQKVLDNIDKEMSHFNEATIIKAIRQAEKEAQNGQ